MLHESAITFDNKAAHDLSWWRNKGYESDNRLAYKYGSFLKGFVVFKIIWYIFAQPQRQTGSWTHLWLHGHRFESERGIDNIDLRRWLIWCCQSIYCWVVPGGTSFIYNWVLCPCRKRQPSPRNFWFRVAGWWGEKHFEHFPPTLTGNFSMIKIKV